MDTLCESKFVDANGIRLHYLDWGGAGPVLIFLAGLGCSAYVYGRFAPRFNGRFHVLGLTRRGHGDSDYPAADYDADTLTEDLLQFMDALHIDQAILAGHSMANVELSHFAALHPERVLKLVYLDASYDRTSALFKSMMEQNPLRTIEIPGLQDDQFSFEEYAAAVRRWYPAWAAIWCDEMDENLRHAVKTSPEGKIVDKMPEDIGKALEETITGYKPEDSKIQAPVLSFIVLKAGHYYLSPDYMSEEQKAQVLEYYDKVRPALELDCIEQLQRAVPHARIVVIPDGHHYCFIKHEELVYDEMSKFLASD